MALSCKVATLAFCYFLADFNFYATAEERNPEDFFKIEITKPPPEDCKRKSKSNDYVSMHYTGYLSGSMKKFDSSRDRNQPFEFTLSTGYVIQGWEKGVVGMCIGEQRRLTIPPEYAYGTSGFGDIIPESATLIFDVELMDIKDSPPEGVQEAMNSDSFETIDADKDGAISWEEMEKHISSRPKQDDEDEPETIVSELFQEGDKNKDGTLSYEEFYGRPKDEL